MLRMGQKSCRESGIELLRIICIFMIILMHSFAMVNAKESSCNLEIIGGVISALGNVGVTCFLLISGYFGIKYNPFKLIHLIYLTTLYSVLTSIICNNNMMDILKSILIIPTYGNWFITCYLILLLIADYIERFIRALSKLEYLNLLILFFVIFSLLPTLFVSYYSTVITGGGKCLTYMLYIYMVGRYFAIYYNLNTKKVTNCFIFTVVTLLIFSLNYVIGNILGRQCRTFSMDCSPFILISAISLFRLFKSMTFKSRLINWISSSVIAIYLLDGLRYYLNEYFCLEKLSTSNVFLLYLLSFVVSIMIISVIIDKIRILVLGKFENSIIAKICRNLRLIKYEKYSSNSLS